MNNLIYFLCSAILIIGCGGPHYGDFFLYHDDGTPKPKVVLLPISDVQKGVYLEENITYYAQDSGGLFIYSKEEVNGVLTRIGHSSDAKSLAPYFKPADFVVETTIICDAYEKSEDFSIPYLRQNPTEHVIRLRLQITDIRDVTPKIIHLEIIEEKALVMARENYNGSFPCLYTALAKKAALRIEDIILYYINCG